MSGRLFRDWPMALTEMKPDAARVLDGATLDPLRPDRAETLLAPAAEACCFRPDVCDRLR